MNFLQLLNQGLARLSVRIEMADTEDATEYAKGYKAGAAMAVNEMRKAITQLALDNPEEE